MSTRLADLVNQATAGDAHSNADDRRRSSADPMVSPEEIKDNSNLDSLQVTPHATPRPNYQDLPGGQRVTHFRTPPTTPSMRTGPPRTISYVYSTPNSPDNSRSNSKHEDGGAGHSTVEEEESEFPFSTPSIFRGALEGGSGNTADKKGKKRESRILEEGWNPMKWFQESPKEEKPGFDFNQQPQDEDDRHGPRSAAPHRDDTPPGERLLRRAFSAPHTPPEKQEKHERNKSGGLAKWGRLKSLLPHVASQTQQSTPGASAVTSHTVNITDELIAGGLSTLMLRLWFERDEKDQRRVPVLFHRLRIRVSDSLHPLQGHKSVFRIECEYANGASRWVVYRQLRDFLSLHTHYAVSNAYNRNVEHLPEFPRTSLPYFKFLKKEGREKGEKGEKGENLGHADFAKMQRESLENYLLDLIRAVMFHPSSNRLAGFLEISALSISLAQSGGAQYKAGYLRIEADKGGFGRKSASWKDRREQRWCSVRESYLVVLEEPGELAVWDVFLLDSDFTIERPKRYYRQGLNLLHGESEEDISVKPNHRLEVHSDAGHDEHKSKLFGSVKKGVSKIFHRNHSNPNMGNGAAHDGASSSSSSASSVSSRAPTPLLDPSTNANPLSGVSEDMGDGQAWQSQDKKKKKASHDVSKHIFFISNAQTKLKLSARNERQMLQWITALERAAATSHYTGSNRFDSFAPIRLNVAAQWLVDGRDYFWNLSRAILLAREVIYIHDWWLSPELQMRRPNKGKYRLDRLLERKAKEGIKIYIILYQEVSNRTTPTDSNYSKQRLTSLHPNIMVQRSPSHFQTGTFYWAHHEKMCVIDQAIAFMGGLDLCFGRWDTPQHVLVDDADSELETSEIWPGKDYSNPRLSDFYNLNKPEEDMYDRTKVPRMPWHDVAMQVVGQPARDLARHFVQRWNYLLRIKNHSRVMPFLLPPPEFRPGELSRLGLTGTCEMQICRSAGPWSIGTPDRIEHSIQNAYLKAIQMSEHFVYIENQFFITSTVVNDVRVENKIGDALVSRIIRAHRDGTPWKCCIIVPALPGFTFPVDHSDASAIRIILECQNRTIARGPNSIFSRLRKEGIDPDDFISVFALRNWGKLKGDILTSEQVYIHAKVCIVDDRLAIIGSANINERSQRGDRDSEIASIIRDTDMIDCTMAGKPFKVGRFAHTLRVRLMREHLGVDVDGMYEEDLMANEPTKNEHEQEPWDPQDEQEYGKEENITKVKGSEPKTAKGRLFHEGLDGADQALHAGGEASSKLAMKGLQKVGLGRNTVAQSAGEAEFAQERTMVGRDGKEREGFAGSMVPTLEEQTVAEHRPPSSQAEGPALGDVLEEKGSPESEGTHPYQSKTTTGDNEPQASTADGELFGAPADASKDANTDDQPPHARSGDNDADEEEQAAPAARATLRKHLAGKIGSKMWTLPVPKPHVDPRGFEDPVSDAFWKNVWVASAVHNTEIYRKVFHAIPDDLVTTWKQYKEFVLHHERLNKPARDTSDPVGRVPSEAGDEGAPGQETDNAEGPGEVENRRSKEGGTDEASETPLNASTSDKDNKRKPARGTEPFEKWEREEMEKLLGELCGHLVLYSNRFLEGEDVANNFLFNADRMLPLPIYN